MSDQIAHSSEFPLLDDAEAAPAGPELGVLIRRIARRWPIIVTLTMLGAAGAYGIVQSLPSEFKASAQLLIVDPTRAASSAAARGSVGSRDVDPLAINTELEVIKSASALERISNKLQLDQIAEFVEPGRIERLKELLRRLGLHVPASSNSPAPDNDVIPNLKVTNALRTKISVERVPLSYIVVVSATTRNSELSVSLVNALLDDYLREQQVNMERQFARSAVWLRARIEELQAKVLDTNTAIERVRTRAGITGDGKGTLAQQQQAELNARLATVRTDVADRKGRIEQLQDPSNADHGGSPSLAQLRLQASVLEQDVTRLRVRLGPQHAEVAAAESRLQSTRQAISDEAARGLAEQQAQYALAQRREQALLEELGRLSDTRVDKTALPQLKELQGSVEADSRLLQTYTSQLEEVEAARSLDGAGKRILSAPSVPTEPSSPRKPLFYGGGAALGFALGLGLAFLGALRSRGIPPGGPGQRRFGHALVGNVPAYSRSPDWQRVARTVRTDAESTLAHAARSIRVGMQVHRPATHTKVVMIASVHRGEGRSTVATALATSAAASGLRVALVDCDRTQRSISAEVGAMREKMTATLNGEFDVGRFGRFHRESGCFIIPMPGLMGADVAPMSAGFVPFLSYLRRAFDLVVLDTPPLLPVPNALGVARHADAVLMVVNARDADQKAIEEALGLLSSPLGHRPDRLVGIVLNRQSRTEMRRAGLWAPRSGSRPIMSATPPPLRTESRRADAPGAAARQDARSLVT